jgi:hypothetical protein
MASKASEGGTPKPKRELPESFRRNAELVAAGKKPIKGKTTNSTKKGR